MATNSYKLVEKWNIMKNWQINRHSDICEADFTIFQQMAIWKCSFSSSIHNRTAIHQRWDECWLIRMAQLFLGGWDDWFVVNSNRIRSYCQMQHHKCNSKVPKNQFLDCNSKTEGRRALKTSSVWHNVPIAVILRWLVCSQLQKEP